MSRRAVGGADSPLQFNSSQPMQGLYVHHTLLFYILEAVREKSFQALFSHHKETKGVETHYFFSLQITFEIMLLNEYEQDLLENVSRKG